MVSFAICTCIPTFKNINKCVISISRSFMINFVLADSFLRFIESQNDFKEVVTHLQKYVYFTWYSGVRALQLRDIYTKSQRVFKKQENLRYVLFTKILTLYFTRFFMKFLKLASTKSTTLSVTWRFYIKKSPTLKKK